MCCWKRSHFCFVPTRFHKCLYMYGYKEEEKKTFSSSKFKTRRNVLSVNPIFVSFIWRRHILSITLFISIYINSCYFRWRKKLKKNKFKHYIIVEVWKVWMLWKKNFYRKKIVQKFWNCAGGFFQSFNDIL